MSVCWVKRPRIRPVVEDSVKYDVQFVYRAQYDHGGIDRGTDGCEGMLRWQDRGLAPDLGWAAESCDRFLEKCHGEVAQLDSKDASEPDDPVA